MECQEELNNLVKQYKRYDITQCSLYKCKSKKRAMKLLRINENEFLEINKIVKYYSFQIDKKDEVEKRCITAPEHRIKAIQKRILELLWKVKRPDWLISGEKGKCYIDNGKAHLLSDYILTVDIKRFYDNCKREYVFRFFKDVLKMSGDIAGLCTDIVTYNNGIPTGCPTSQLIAYHAYESMFAEIAEKAKEYGCTFTLYVDDMTFSSKEPFDVNGLKSNIDVVLRKYGHKPKYKKVMYYTKTKSKPITGTIITSAHELKVPNRLQQKIYNGFQNIKELQGKELTYEDLKNINSLKGQIQAAKNIESDKFPEISRLVNAL